MRSIEQILPSVFIIEPNLHADDRGVFRRSFCRNEFGKAGIEFNVLQGNISKNFTKHTMRGFHYQVEPSKESKIITCISGSLHNIVLDLRHNSPTRYEWVAIKIDEFSGQSIFVPAGCANAFLTMSDNTFVHYYMGDSFEPKSYRGIRYNDPRFNFIWPCEPRVISDKDRNFPDFSDE